MEIRELIKEDYHCGFLQLLEQLTTVDAANITFQDFCQQSDNVTSKVFVIKIDNRIMGTAAVFIEHKFIHHLSSVAHIEDVVVDQNYRGVGLGKLLMNRCVEYAKTQNVYKIILDCDEKNVAFYEKCGFSCKNVQMSVYV